MKNKVIHIGEKPVGENCPAFIIAEAGINHNGKIELAKKLIDVAVEARADAVKFQMRDFKTLYTENAFNNTKHEDIASQYLLSLIRESTLSEENFKELSRYAKQKGIIFLCTPWDIASVETLEKLNVPAYKLASADLVNLELIEHIASKNKPLILSTGMSSPEEIETTVKHLDSLGAEYILLHCNSAYPAAAKDINLRYMDTLREKFDCIVGYSGHELGLAISMAAATLGAKVIERHITLDRTMTGPDHAISLEPAGIIKLVRDIRRIEEALQSDRKFITAGEFMNRKILGKSLVATRPIKSGETITRDMITAKSPAKGLSPQMLHQLVGKKAQRDITKDGYFTEEDMGKKKYERAFSSKRKWGLIVRPHDFEEMIEGLAPRFAEFHFSSHDLAHPLVFKNHTELELIAHAPELWGDKLLDFCSDDTGVTKTSINHINDFLEKVREARKYFGKTPPKVKVVLHPGGMSYNGFVSKKDRAKMYTRLGNALKKLNTTGIELLLENLPPFPWYKGGAWFSNTFMDAEEIRDFAKKYGYSLCYDSSHAQLYCTFAKKDPVEFFKTLKPLVKHIHLSDGVGTDGEGIQIDEGDVRWSKLMPEILRANVTMAPEIWMGHRYNGEGFLVALNRLKKFNL
ncbi:MAG: N-acylneuraminate-9-phosphate synthase [Parcubacteria group bacterium GW2011_GWA2_47_16]|nr:MAG: N-acylneuraminate-9-phosphate synthase [Parcubacteria group bacterium GW2011_GWA2_47_16]